MKKSDLLLMLDEKEKEITRIKSMLADSVIREQQAVTVLQKQRQRFRDVLKKKEMAINELNIEINGFILREQKHKLMEQKHK